MSELPSNQNLDIRENGRLQTSLNILEELLISNAQFPQIWSRKIIVLKYLAHGHWSYGSALAMTTQPEAKTQFKVSKSYAKKLLPTTKQSVENFPDDEWFAFEREEALEDFSEWADSV